MEVSAQLHVPSALLLWKSLRLGSKQEAGTVAVSVSTLSKRKTDNFLPPVNETGSLLYGPHLVLYTDYSVCRVLKPLR